MFQDSVRTAQ